MSVTGYLWAGPGYSGKSTFFAAAVQHRKDQFRLNIRNVFLILDVIAHLARIASVSCNVSACKVAFVYPWPEVNSVMVLTYKYWCSWVQIAVNVAAMEGGTSGVTGSAELWGCCSPWQNFRKGPSFLWMSVKHDDVVKYTDVQRPVFRSHAASSFFGFWLGIIPSCNCFGS